MKHRSILEVNLGLLKKNCQILRHLAGNSFFCPMVKADAYGHGVGPVVQALQSVAVQQVGVISIDEAQTLRKTEQKMDILIFGPVLSKEEIAWAVENKLILVSHCWNGLKKLAELKKPARIHLKIDTGFSRLGFPLEDTEKLYDFLKKHPQIKLEALATQLVSGEEVGNQKSFSYRQIELLKQAQKIFSCENIHVLNTSALIALSTNEKKVSVGVRPGIGLYGIKPSVSLLNVQAEKEWKNLVLHPVSCLKSYVVDLHNISKGTPVSYGGRWKAPRDSQIATVSIGYGDGFFRSLSASREVLFRGKRRKIVGAVCMDFFMIDVTEDQNHSVQLGEEVVLFGKQGNQFLSVQEQVIAVKSIPYELFSRLGHRVKRVYIA